MDCGAAAELTFEAWFSLSLLNSGRADDLSGGERIEAVDEGDADLDSSSLAV